MALLGRGQHDGAPWMDTYLAYVVVDLKGQCSGFARLEIVDHNLVSDWTENRAGIWRKFDGPSMIDGAQNIIELVGESHCVTVCVCVFVNV